MKHRRMHSLGRTIIHFFLGLGVFGPLLLGILDSSFLSSADRQRPACFRADCAKSRSPANLRAGCGRRIHPGSCFGGFGHPQKRRGGLEEKNESETLRISQAANERKRRIDDQHRESGSAALSIHPGYRRRQRISVSARASARDRVRHPLYSVLTGGIRRDPLGPSASFE